MYSLLFCLTVQKQQQHQAERGRVCACICVYVCVRACVCVCAHACVLDGEVSWVFASTALTVVQMAMCLTSYNDCLTGFCEPLLPLYRCHTGLKNVCCYD